MFGSSMYCVITLVAFIACLFQVTASPHYFCKKCMETTVRRTGDGFCFKKYAEKTGECKGLMKGNRVRQKVDCCSNGGQGWSARKKDRTRCEPCRTSITETSYWTTWGDWGRCNATCGPSVKIRTRSCISKGAKTCQGRREKRKTCKTDPCPIDGGWSHWGRWSPCSVTCGRGTKERTRTCTNPRPQFDGKDCQGLLANAKACQDRVNCPIHGGWGEWGSWSACSLTCGLGQKTRERVCDNPVPKYGGTPCNETERVQPGYCRTQRCEDTDISGDYSGSGSGWEIGSGSGSSGSSGSGWGEWDEFSGHRAWSNSDDEDY